MDKQEEKKDFYGSLKVDELKQLLKSKGAKIGGRKAELVERLIFYDKNNNFGFEQVKPDERIQTPPPVNYKDINSSSPCPSFTENHLKIFLNKYETSDEKAQKLYDNGFLKYFRCSNTDSMYYVKGCCKAEMKKHMKYCVDICLSLDAEMQGSSCECPVGQSNEAHCKHVIIVLVAIRDFVDTKTVITEQTCTQQLQTFHQLGKKYAGSPIKAEKFRKNDFPSVCDKATEDFKIWYGNYFRNLIISGGMNSNMSLKQIVEPANMYAVQWDHSFYTKNSAVDVMLESLHVRNVSEDVVAQIELDTRKQSESSAWKLERRVRLTASTFYSCCCRYKNPEGAKTLVNRIMNPVPFKSKATEHGKIHEAIAVKKFEAMFENNFEITECGLFVPVDRPYLGATPDRLLFEKAVVEVKCLYTNRNLEIDEKTAPFLERDSNNCLRLKKKHPYYYQVQGQLYVTGRNVCEFVIYTFVDISVISVKRDDDFIIHMLQELDYFYDTYLKPALLEKYLYKNYEAAFFTDDVLKKLNAKRFNPCE